MSCQINTKMKLQQKKSISFFLSFLFLFALFLSTHMVSSWTGIYGMFASNLVSLIRRWFTISMIQQLGRGSSPLIISGTTYISTQYLSKHVAFTHSFLLFSLSSPPPPPSPSFPPSLPLPWILRASEVQKRHETHGDRQKHIYLLRSHSLMSVYIDENKN